MATSPAGHARPPPGRLRDRTRTGLLVACSKELLSGLGRDAIYTIRMEATVSGVVVHYAEYGRGTPVLALHGAGVDHREIAGGLEPIFGDVPGFRRLYPDLPGMGRTPAPGSITSNDDVLDILLGLIDSTIAPFLVMGHVLVSSAELTGKLGPELEASYRNYFVVQTTETLSRFQGVVAPAATLADQPSLMRIFSH